jgi:hypothetical protein
MTIKNEQFKDQAEFDLMLEFLTNNLPPQHSISAMLLATMIQARAGALLVRRDEAGILQAAQIWIAIPNPLAGGKRLCKMVGECGDTAGFDMVRDAIFSMYDGGWELL